MSPKPYLPKEGTPTQEGARKQAWAAFLGLAGALYISRTHLRVWLADEMGIEQRYCIINDMDEVECMTVVDICNERKAKHDQDRRPGGRQRPAGRPGTGTGKHASDPPW